MVVFPAPFAPRSATTPRSGTSKRDPTHGRDNALVGYFEFADDQHMDISYSLYSCQSPIFTCPLSRLRAMMKRCISSVPSKMRKTRISRYHRSMGNSLV